MTQTQATYILNRVRAGDKTPTQREITEALIICGDICSWMSPLAKDAA